MANSAMTPDARDRAVAESLMRQAANFPHSPNVRAAITAALATARAEERAECVAVVELEAERIRHTLHRDGLGMGWQAGEHLLGEIAAALRARGEG